MKYLILSLFIFSFVGCGNQELPTDKPLSACGGIVEQELTTNTQNISIIYDKRFNNWVETHKNAVVVSICPLDYAGHGATTGFIIFWTGTRVIESNTQTININGKTYNVSNESLQKINSELNK